jgi:hypothetical protein
MGVGGNIAGMPGHGGRGGVRSKHGTTAPGGHGSDRSICGAKGEPQCPGAQFMGACIGAAYIGAPFIGLALIGAAGARLNAVASNKDVMAISSWECFRKKGVPFAEQRS